MITPTVGRVMWYKPYDHESNINDRAVPFVAHVCYVWQPDMINALVIDHQGNAVPHTSIPVWQGDFEDCPEGSCCWMPYQKGQAAKTEKLEEELAESTA